MYIHLYTRSLRLVSVLVSFVRCVPPAVLFPLVLVHFREHLLMFEDLIHS